jgi:hypothetical protein
MKKTYLLNVKNKTPERQVDLIKYEVKKYIARERRKELPDGVDFWDFDCKIGDNEEVAATIHLSEINKMISKISVNNNESFYLEILARPAKRMK